MQAIARKYKLEKRKNIITNQMSSGLTTTEYCRQEKLQISTIFYWKRTIRQDLIAQMDTQISEPAIVELPLTISKTSIEEAPSALSATSTDVINGLAEIAIMPRRSGANLFMFNAYLLAQRIQRMYTVCFLDMGKFSTVIRM